VARQVAIAQDQRRLSPPLFLSLYPLTPYCEDELLSCILLEPADLPWRQQRGACGCTSVGRVNDYRGIVDITAGPAAFPVIMECDIGEKRRPQYQALPGRSPIASRTTQIHVIEEVRQ